MNSTACSTLELIISRISNSFFFQNASENAKTKYKEEKV